MSAARLASLTCLVAMLLGGTACTRGADEPRLEQDLRAKLDQNLKPGLFELVALRRQGSAPLPADDSGAPRVIVYFNATLRLAQDYTFGEWDQLGPSSVAYALGATEKGVFGLEPHNRAGAQVRAYGSAIYERTPDGWAAVDAVAPQSAAAAPDLDGTGPSPRSKQLIDRLAAMVNLPPPGVTPQQDEIIAEELERASENIERRVQRREHTFTLATGPAGSAYARFGRSLIEAVNAAAPQVKLRQRASQGSIENTRLLARGEADYAIVQGDVAAAALAGEDVFARGAPLDGLRAVGALFPEAVHVVVLADSPIGDVAQLEGRRVNIGPAESGTRFDAVAVLEAHGLTPRDLAEAREDDPAQSLTRLKRRQLDAVFVTTLAPMRALQELALSPGMRLVPIADDAMRLLVHRRAGLTPLLLPANTYPRQPHPILTAASAALLVTMDDTPDAEVARVADLVFRRMPGTPSAGSADVVRVSPANERRGVTIPLHRGATRRGDPGTE